MNLFTYDPHMCNISESCDVSHNRKIQIYVTSESYDLPHNHMMSHIII